MAESLAAPRVVPSPPRPAPDHHLVQFYDREEFLYSVVGEFLGEGLVAGESLIVIAIPEHREAFCGELRARGHDVEALTQAGRLTLLDARQTLGGFMRDGRPDASLFQATVGELVGRVARQGAAGIRAYGEMVDLLWREGNPPAAIDLEELWNGLARVHSFALLCAYVMGNFYREAHGPHFDQICRSHTHVSPTEEFAQDAEPRRLREIAWLQQRARALQAEVEHRKALEVELRRKNEELQRSVRFSELFAGMLGHDLRNPLSGIKTAAGLIARRADGERIALPAGRILSSAERMSRMVDQLLDLTRIRLAGGLPLQVGECDLAAVCRLTADELSPPEVARVVVDVEGDATGQWDRDRLGQLLSNLLGNALNHGTPGSAITARIDGTARDQVVLEVHNHGEIAADLMPSLFELLKGTQHKRERSSGLGLGLFIGRQIAEAHGGSIEVASSSAEGTRFIVRLPRACAAAPAALS